MAAQKNSSFPRSLFKYQSPAGYSIQNLRDQFLWFSDPLLFNDPFDCAIGLIESSIRKGFAVADTATCIRLIERMNPGPDFLNMLVQRPEGDIRTLAERCLIENLDVFCKPGVCCFSEKVDDLLMWGHYADKHKGFCLELSTVERQLKFPPNDN